MEPTLGNRIKAMDVLRGFAVLGILLANIPAFAAPMFDELFGVVHTVPLGVDRWLDTLVQVFVVGKFRSTLAILFGAGLYLQFQKRSREGSWPGGYIKRNAFLGLFGLVHGYLIWMGDILLLYSIAAFITVWLVDASDRVVYWIVGLVAAGSALVGGLLAVFSSTSLGGANPTESPINLWPFRHGDELQVFSEGSYLHQVQARLGYFSLVLVLILFLLPSIVSLFLIGTRLARSGVLAEPSKHPKARRVALFVGFGIGLPLNLLAFAQLGVKEPSDLSATWELFVGPLMSVGYVMLGAIVVEKGLFQRLTGAMAKVGRLALTSYLSQSVLCTAIFYSWGGDLFGRLPMSQYYLVVPLVWALNVGFATLWLRTHDIGPVEWVLRSLTEGRRMPWKAPQVPVVEAQA